MRTARGTPTTKASASEPVCSETTSARTDNAGIKADAKLEDVGLESGYRFSVLRGKLGRQIDRVEALLYRDSDT